MNMRQPTIRPAIPADASKVWPLARDFATSFQPEEVPFLQNFPLIIDDPAALMLVAEEGEAIVGYILAHSHLTFLANGPVVWVEELMVASSRRLSGLGSELMAIYR